MKFRVLALAFVVFSSISVKASDVDSLMMDAKIDSLIKISNIGEKYAKMDNFDSAYYYLNNALTLVSELNLKDIVERDIMIIPAIYNAMGVYCFVVDRDYNSAISYFHKAMDYTELYKLWNEYCSVVHNLVYAFFTKGDADGMAYAQNLFDKGIEIGNEKMQTIGAYSLASMYYLKEDMENAKFFIDKVINEKDIEQITVNVNSLRANIYLELGDYKTANQYFTKAMGDIHNINTSEGVFICISYARCLLKVHDYSNAIDVIYRGIQLVENRGIRDFEQTLYLLLSQAYDGNGQWKSAYEAYKKYHTILLEITDVQKQKEISEIMLKYDTKAKELELRNAENLIKRRRSQLIFSLIVIVLMVILAVVFITLYSKQKRTYRSIVEKYKNTKRASGDYSASENEKMNEIYVKLEKLMNEDHIYRNASITREELSEMLGTNRTYLSTIISELSGKTFTKYINSYRIAECVKILSDKSNKETLKSISETVGFNSLATFYRIFQEEIGMPPAKFRELSNNL